MKACGAFLLFRTSGRGQLASVRSKWPDRPCGTARTRVRATQAVPTSDSKGLELWEAPQRLGGLDGPSQPTGSLRWARRPAGRGVPPPPDARRSCRAACLTCARRPRSPCPADPLPRPRLYGRQASTPTCAASSPWRPPTTSWCAIMTSCPEVLRRVRVSGGGGAVARAHRLLCGWPRAAEGLDVGGWARLSAGLLGAF